MIVVTILALYNAYTTPPDPRGIGKNSFDGGWITSLFLQYLIHPTFFRLVRSYINLILDFRLPSILFLVWVQISPGTTKFGQYLPAAQNLDKIFWLKLQQFLSSSIIVNSLLRFLKSDFFCTFLFIAN